MTPRGITGAASIPLIAASRGVDCWGRVGPAVHLHHQLSAEGIGRRHRTAGAFPFFGTNI